MVASIGQMASAEYYLESQRSFRHPNEYYTAGEEPDGTWFNPKDLFHLEDGVKVDAGQFQRLYNGFAPDGTGGLVQRAGNPGRSPGIDMTFSVDKSISALWAIAEPETRQRIEAIATAAARAALEDSVLKHCSYTRLAENGVTRPVEADLMGATFVHGTSRENDPQLHVHCTIFNVARTREDGKWRAHHQYPVYSWKKAAGALFRANMAWELQQGLGVRMEQYGPNNEFTRIVGMPDDLKAFWSKRRKAIVAMAGELGIPSLGNASRMAGVNKITREGKSHDNDPEIRHRRWRGEAEGFVEREELIASVTGHEVEIGREAIRELTDRLDELPAHLAREEAVFRRPDMVEAAANAAAGLMGREAVGTAIERLRRNPEIERLEPKKPTAESKAGMVHTEVYSTRHNLGLEQAVRDMAEAMAVDTGHALPEEAVKETVETLLEQGYPLSQEQSLAIRHATIKGGRVAVIEGAAGSGKTTTLRPITDLHKEHGYEIVPTAVAWRTAVALGDDCDARAYCVDKLLKLAAKGQVEIGRNTLIVVDEAGMLSTRQAHHILQLSERHGAKVVFAGDTRQQQPVEAGPGLRLVSDVAGSIRVDRIRRQKADLEDVLVHVHNETPEQARFRAGLTSQEERTSILAKYEAMERKPVFTPWQVAVSEALRDGEAEKAIEAWHLRNRLHLCHDEEKALTRLADDWERHVRARPGTSTVVLARTKAEGRALSWLMRERVLSQTPEAKRAVIEVSRDLDGRLTEPLEVAVGDRIRIGATQWEKQLFNGTVVTVEDLEVKRAEAGAVTRKARNRTAAGKDLEARCRPSPTGVLGPHSPRARTTAAGRVPARRDPRLARQHPPRLRLRDDHRLGPGADRGQGVPPGGRQAGAGDHLSRRDPAPRGARHLRQPRAHRLRHRRAPARGRGGAAGPGQRRPVVSGRAMVALAAQGGGARLRLRRHVAGCAGGRAASPAQDRRDAARDGRGPCRCQRQRAGAHRPGHPPCGQRLAPRRGRRRVRGRAQRGSGGLGRPPRPRPGPGRCRCAQPRLPRDPGPPRRAHEAGGFVHGPSAGIRAASHRARRDWLMASCRSCTTSMPGPAATFAPRRPRPPTQRAGTPRRRASGSAGTRSGRPDPRGVTHPPPQRPPNPTGLPRGRARIPAGAPPRSGRRPGSRPGARPAGRIFLKTPIAGSGATGAFIAAGPSCRACTLSISTAPPRWSSGSPPSPGAGG